MFCSLVQIIYVLCARNVMPYSLVCLLSYKHVCIYLVKYLLLRYADYEHEQILISTICLYLYIYIHIMYRK